ncbi:hypothetical protein [Carp edema virus]|nr:hypothetical protein [Carp edema virus]
MITSKAIMVDEHPFQNETLIQINGRNGSSDVMIVMTQSKSEETKQIEVNDNDIHSKNFDMLVAHSVFGNQSSITLNNNNITLVNKSTLIINTQNNIPASNSTGSIFTISNNTLSAEHFRILATNNEKMNYVIRNNTLTSGDKNLGIELDDSYFQILVLDSNILNNQNLIITGNDIELLVIKNTNFNNSDFICTKNIIKRVFVHGNSKNLTCEDSRIISFLDSAQVDEILASHNISLFNRSEAINSDKISLKFKHTTDIEYVDEHGLFYTMLVQLGTSFGITMAIVGSMALITFFIVYFLLRHRNNYKRLEEI